MKNQNRENEEKDRLETEKATGREKVDEGSIRKRKTQKEIVLNRKQRRAKKYNRGEKQKTGNIFSVLQEEDLESILEEEELPPCIKIDKEEKK